MSVSICECFARDGLQHEVEPVATAAKVRAIDLFSQAGFRRIEATSYSRPEKVPAFHDASDVLRAIGRRPGVRFKATCPNVTAVERAVRDAQAGFGADEISLLISASDGHSQRNLRTTRDRQWQNIEQMVACAGGRFVLVGVISVAFGCPIDGRIDPRRVLEDVARFLTLGVRLITIGDTTGYADPVSSKRLFREIVHGFPEATPIAHFHDSRGAGLANAVAALEAGCTHFDSAIGGVGGHPAQIEYGGGMTGNVATEDLVGTFESMGVDTGIDLGALMAASEYCEQVLGRKLHSRVARSGLGFAFSGAA